MTNETGLVSIIASFHCSLYHKYHADDSMGESLMPLRKISTTCRNVFSPTTCRFHFLHQCICLPKPLSNTTILQHHVGTSLRYVYLTGKSCEKSRRRVASVSEHFLFPSSETSSQYTAVTRLQQQHVGTCLHICESNREELSIVMYVLRVVDNEPPEYWRLMPIYIHICSTCYTQFLTTII